MMNTTFNNDEMNLMCIYNRDGSRKGIIAALKAMRRYLVEDEQELLALTDSTLQKLERISDGEFEELELVPDF